MLDQLEVLDAALPGLRAAAEAPFAITVGGREFTDRAEAAPALLDAARDAYQRGRNHGASRAFPIAEIAGVGVQASRWLTSDELAITLTVPARTTNLEATELRQPDATGMGLLRRVENLARGGDQHRDGLARRYDLATTRLAAHWRRLPRSCASTRPGPPPPPATPKHNSAWPRPGANPGGAWSSTPPRPCWSSWASTPSPTGLSSPAANTSTSPQ